MKYRYNDIQDFLSDDSFVQWVLSAKNEPYWQTYLESNPSKNTMVEEARQLILELHQVESADGDQLDQNFVWGRIKKRIKALENQEESYVPKKAPIIFPFWKRSTVRWASSVVLVLGLSFVLWIIRMNNRVSYQSLVASMDEKNTIVERINHNDVPLKVKLEDGSTITLEKNSKLSFPSHFGKSRRYVVLSGEAFFEITKNPDKPFFVYANEVVTKVLGTSFRIHSFEGDENIIVKVRTGKVSVYNQRQINLNDPETRALILIPNQQAVYNRKSADLSKRLVEIPMPIEETISVHLRNQFDDVAASEIFGLIEKRYGVEIMFDEDRMSGCFVTTQLKGESLYDQLDLICSIIGGTYKVVDTQIIIESKGCK